MKKYLIFVVLILGYFSVHAQGVNLNCSSDQHLCNNCPQHQTLFPIEKFSKNNGVLDIEADESEILEGKYLLSGNVQVNSENLFLSANDVEVSSSDNSILATGKVKFQDELYLITSDYLSASRGEDDNLIATATNANYQDYSVGYEGANGYTEVIEKTPTSVVLTNATYSLCPINKNDWLIDADNIELKLDKNRGVADSAKVIFYGIPIFYLPKYSWVLQGRGSGFLTPDYDNYNEPSLKDRSYRIRVPYYFNIAPDRDLVAALNYMSSRGFIYEGKYRQLIAPRVLEEREDSIWETELMFLSNDKMSNLKRWLLDSSVEYDYTDKLHLSSRYHRVSDKNYFKEILRTDTTKERLLSNLTLEYKDKENEFESSITSNHEQLVNKGVAKYTKDLEGSISKTFRIGQKKKNDYHKSRSALKLSDEQNILYLSENPPPVVTRLDVDFKSSKFAHSDSSEESGLRTHGNSKLSRILAFPKYPSITPYTSISLTHYSLNKSNKNITRTVGGAGLMIDFSTERNTKLFNSKVNHRFSPIIRYDYRAKKLQGNIPIFDSTDKYDDIITFADLTSGERYTGLDRVTNANDINLSLESSFRKLDAKKEDKDLLNFKISQSFYSDNEVVSDNSSNNFETRKSYSDIAAEASSSINNFTLSSAVQFNPDKSIVVKKENRLSYSPSSRQFISLSYSDDSIKRVGKIYGAYPLSSKIHMFGGLDREITKLTSTGVSKTYTTGLAYESCCWAVRIAHFQEDKNEGNNSNNYSTGIELILKGLGSTSTPMRGRVENNIPGYSSELW
jgi:LPS-assembly protein